MKADYYVNDKITWTINEKITAKSLSVKLIIPIVNDVLELRSNKAANDRLL